jgi:hypothetical protein
VSRVYVFPASEEDLLGSDTSRGSPVRVMEAMTEGDHLVRRYGDQLRLWRVGPDGAEWLGEVPVASLPEDATTMLSPDEVQTPDDSSSLAQALDGIESALRERGG